MKGEMFYKCPLDSEAGKLYREALEGKRLRTQYIFELFKKYGLKGESFYDNGRITLTHPEDIQKMKDSLTTKMVVKVKSPLGKDIALAPKYNRFWFYDLFKFYGHISHSQFSSLEHVYFRIDGDSFEPMKDLEEINGSEFYLAHERLMEAQNDN